MNSSLMMGLFAFYVVAISLWRLLASKEMPQLLFLKKVWGWRKGLALHFLTQVGVPMLFGIVFLSRGVAGFEPSAANEPFAFDPGLRQQLLVAHSSLPPLSRLAEDISLAYTGEDTASERFRSDFASVLDRPMNSLIIRSADILLP